MFYPTVPIHDMHAVTKNESEAAKLARKSKREQEEKEKGVGNLFTLPGGGSITRWRKESDSHQEEGNNSC